jgi:protein-tyrosine phosphatase
VPVPYRIAFVCSGNICRSPMAEVVVRSLAEQEGLAAALVVESSGTGDWHVGRGADPRALDVLRSRGYDGTAHRARQVDPRDLSSIDLLVALDRGHARALRSLARTPEDRGKIRLLRSFDPDADSADVADPYLGDVAGFAAVLDQVEAAAPGLLAHVRAELAR